LTSGPRGWMDATRLRRQSKVQGGSFLGAANRHQRPARL